MTQRSQAIPSAVAIVQARMGSSRLPGKTMEPLGDWRVVDWVVHRVAAADAVRDVIVATTDLPGDDVLVEHLGAQGVEVARGRSDDVLARFVGALVSTDAALVVRVTADCPFLDPGVIDLGAATIVDAHADYVATGLDGRYPRGLDVEVFRREALLRAHRETSDPEEREHVTPYIYRHPEVFRCAPIGAPGWAARPDLRFTLDEPADLALLRAVVRDLGSDRLLATRDIVSYLDAHPDVVAMNAGVEHRNITF